MMFSQVYEAALWGLRPVTKLIGVIILAFPFLWIHTEHILHLKQKGGTVFALLGMAEGTWCSLADAW